MATKWKNLSYAQRDLMLELAGRPQFVLGPTRLVLGILMPYTRESRTAKALEERELVRWVWVDKDGVPRNGLTLTQKGADILVPPGKVTWPRAEVASRCPGGLDSSKPSKMENEHGLAG